MKAVKNCDGFRSIRRRIHGKQDDAGRPGVGRLQNEGGIQCAGRDAKLGMAAQGAGQQLGLHAIGVGDEHTDRLRSGGKQLHRSPDVIEVMPLILGSGSVVHKESDHKMWIVLSKRE